LKPQQSDCSAAGHRAWHHQESFAHAVFGNGGEHAF
jgi:hypothetical protein